ncbi:hypothetical protein QFC21_006305 [Naganishia friedmannii]|uniref:Uncharacterized protein n=1 Tax=Naganishia friedmannii TaxID=89922 RepID=A0ACC2V3F4_9TREE|nr:hypothetical protein QFC21_006305 [Naganishia friedmannii]
MHDRNTASEASTTGSTIPPPPSKDGRDGNKELVLSSLVTVSHIDAESSTQRTFCDRQTGDLTAGRGPLEDSVAGSQEAPLVPDLVDLLAKATHGLSLDSDVEGKQPEGYPPHTDSLRSPLGEEQVVLSREEKKLQSDAFLAGKFGLVAQRPRITECMEMQANSGYEHTQPGVTAEDDNKDDYGTPEVFRRRPDAGSSAGSSVHEADFDFFPDPHKAEGTDSQPLDLADEEKRRRGSPSFKIQPAADES